MNRETAKLALRSQSPHERLKAARFLARDATAEDLGLLKHALQSETVSYVKTSLNIGIARLTNIPRPVKIVLSDEEAGSAELRHQIKNQAIDWIAGLLLHEIASPIGLVKRTASREIPDFENSKTRRHLDNLQRIFEAIEQLKNAAAIPRPEDFDLAELVSETVNAEIEAGQMAEVSLHGQRPFVISSDPALVRFAISNGIRNAFEAIGSIGTEETHAIVISWGETDVDFWVAVLDKGPGITGPIESAFEIGKTTKQGHSGFGLAIARQAIQTLGGTISLRPSAQGGARYEARWEK